MPERNGTRRDVTERPLRVVLAMATFVPAGMGGTETFARALVSGLAEREDIDLEVLVSRAAAGTMDAPNEMVLRHVGGGASTVQRLRTLAQAAVPGSVARALIRGADVVHYPFTVPVPGPQGVPWVQSLHDVQHLDLPEMFSRAERAYRRLAYDLPARRANRIVTISEFSKGRIVERLGIDPDRIDVAHLGVDRAAFAYYDGPREPFVLYPATAWPHKNHARLIEAMKLVRLQRPGMRLVLTGGRRAALGALPEWVEHRGYVTEANLRRLYRSACCLAFPSLYEGFGLPPLEAMASGCPVAAASSGSLPEVCGTDANYFDPRDVKAMAEAIDTALDQTDEQRRSARDHVVLFGWDACIAAHVLAFQSVQGGRA
jgi:glycosyltransferase involved in cell wall biosynthesis